MSRGIAIVASPPTSERPRERSASEPERTCAGCRERAPQRELIRYVREPEGGAVVPDPQAKLPGRGAYAHPRRACLQAAVRKGGFARSFKGPVRVELESLLRDTAAILLRRQQSLLLSALRRGRVVLGGDACRAAFLGTGGPRAARGGARVGCLLLAEDAAGRREELIELADRAGAQVIEIGSKSSLGRLAGRAEVGAIAILDAGIAEEIARTATRVRELSEAQ